MAEGKADTLFLACTRPAMFLGIPLGAYAALLVGCGEFFELSGLAGNGLLRLIITAAMAGTGYATCRLLVSWDHNIFGILFLWFTTKVRTVANWAYWGGSSVSPYPLHQPKDTKDVTFLA